MDDAPSFGQWLRAQRQVHDLTREALARQVGCAVVTIKKIETNERRPSRQIAERLLAVLNVPTQDQPAIMHLARATPVLEQPALVATPGVPSTLDSDDLSDHVVKGYELRERIGSGGFGAVYRALQTGVGREVAVKVILARHADHPEFIRRFETEAQIIARLEHPYIVPLYDYWREPGGAYLVMRYVRGGSVQATLGKEVWPLERVARLLDHVGAALHFAHQRGVVHRDVKPANMLLDSEGNAYLADFGIAKDLWSAAPDALTQTGAIIGSPAYLSPEQIKDEPITPQTDIYSLGIVLYELLTSSHPFTNLTPAERLAKQLNELLPPLSTTRPGLPSAYDGIIQRATAKRPTDRYPDVLHLLMDWQRATTLGHSASTHQLLSTTLSMVTPFLSDAPVATDASSMEATDAATAADFAQVENPYKGLRAFSQADVADFFGRKALTERLLERLAEERADARFLAVVGPSGSGKSSVVSAGLVPALRRGGLPGSEQWFVAEILPSTHPFDELELALLKIATAQPPDLREHLDRDARGLVRAARLILPDDTESELLLVIDQFEELWTLVEEEAVRSRFLNTIVAAMSDSRSRVRVIITLRADFYDRPLLYSQFGELMRQRTEVVLPLTTEELVQAISGPAQRVGVQLEPGLTRLITKDVGDQPGTLPLLQYALTELFERREDNMLTLSAYQSSGAVLGALARRADELYTNLDPPGQEAVRQLFLRLVTLGEGVEDTRRRIRREELTTFTNDAPRSADEHCDDHAAPFVLGPTPTMDGVIDLYGRYRLLTFDRDSVTRGSTVEIAHEALIRAWMQLRVWLDVSRTNLQVQRQLATAAQEWTQSEHDPSFLAVGARLTQFEALALDSDLALNVAEMVYLHASIEERDQRVTVEHERQGRELALQKRAARRLQYLVGGLVLFLTAAVGLSVFAFNSRADAIAQRQQADANLTRSEAQRLAAEANALAQTHGVAEVIGLLSIRSMDLQYSSQGDAALAGAATLDYPEQQFIGHSQLIACVAFSPDGKYVLTGSGDTTARLWNRQTGKEIRQFVGHSASVQGVAFSPDGKYVLTGSTDTTARLWDIDSGNTLQTFSGHAGPVNAVAFSPDGQYMMTGSDDKTARLWNVQTGATVRSFTGHTDVVLVVAFSPDGTQALTGSYDKTARLWDMQTGHELHNLSDHTGSVQGAAFS